MGGRLFHTAADGRVAIELPSGSYDITAAKNKYVGATTRVRVTACPSMQKRRDESLAGSPPDACREGEPQSFKWIRRARRLA